MRFSRLHIKRLALAGIILPLLAFSACIKDTGIDNPTPGDDKEATVKFSLVLPGSAATPTRALSEGNENEARTIEVLVFGPGGGSYRYTAYCSDITTDGSDVSIKTFTVKLATGSCDLVVLANARELIPAAYPTGIPVGATQIDVYNKLNMPLPAGGKWNAKPTDAAYKPIPMWGFKTSVNIQANTTLTGGSAIKLARMVAKVDVTVLDAAKPNFKLTSIRLYNYQTQGSVVPKAGWDAAGSKATMPNVPTGSVRTKGPLLYDGTAITTANVSCLNEIYLFEAPKGGQSAAERANNTCIVVGGKYGSETKETYYRIDFAQKVNDAWEYLPILRNHRYHVRIASIGGPGFDTPDNAFNAEPVNIQADVIKWSDDNMSEIIFDGLSYMKVDRQRFDLNKLAQNASMTVETDITGCTATVTYTAPQSGWITNLSITGTPGIGSLKFRTLDNTSGQERKATIIISAGRLRKEIPVVQSTSMDVSLSVDPRTLIFEQAGGSEPVTINWQPVTKPLYFNPVAVNNGGVTFSTPIPASVVNQPLPYTLNVQVAPMTVPAGYTMYEKSTIINVLASDGEGNEMYEAINVRQIAYGVQPSPNNPEYYIMDGTTEHTYYLQSNAPWEITAIEQGKVSTVGSTTITDDTKQILLSSADLFVGKTGEGNESGTALKFKLVDDINNTSIFAGVVKLTVTIYKGTARESSFPIYIYGASGLQGGLANCYIMKPGGVGYFIPVAQANADGTTRIAQSSVMTAEILWADVPGGLKADGSSAIAYVGVRQNAGGVNGQLLVMPGRQTGNAVVCVKVGGVIKWSWHIWITDYDPNTGVAAAMAGSQGRYDTPGGHLYKIMYNDYNVIMDRFLGAYHNAPVADLELGRMGLLYQHGRKDPFSPAPTSEFVDLVNYYMKEPTLYLGNAGTSSTTAIAKASPTSTNNLENAIMNPMTFYTHTSSQDWYSNVASSGGGSFWTATGAKGVFDPCPEGWRVARRGQLGNFTNMTITSNISDWARGAVAKYTGYYPAVGYRLANASGVPAYMEQRTIFWYAAMSSTPSRGESSTIYIATVLSATTSETPRGNGQNVRCERDWTLP